MEAHFGNNLGKGLAGFHLPKDLGGANPRCTIEDAPARRAEDFELAIHQLEKPRVGDSPAQGWRYDMRANATRCYYSAVPGCIQRIYRSRLWRNRCVPEPKSGFNRRCASGSGKGGGGCGGALGLGAGFGKHVRHR